MLYSLLFASNCELYFIVSNFLILHFHFLLSHTFSHNTMTLAVPLYHSCIFILMRTLQINLHLFNFSDILCHLNCRICQLRIFNSSLVVTGKNVRVTNLFSQLSFFHLYLFRTYLLFIYLFILSTLILTLLLILFLLIYNKFYI